MESITTPQVRGRAPIAQLVTSAQIKLLPPSYVVLGNTGRVTLVNNVVSEQVRHKPTCTVTEKS